MCPYKDPDKQREAVRKSVKKHRDNLIATARLVDNFDRRLIGLSVNLSSLQTFFLELEKRICRIEEKVLGKSETHVYSFGHDLPEETKQWIREMREKQERQRKGET